MPSATSLGCLLSTRTSRPASRSRATTSRPSVPVPPVTRMGDVITRPLSSSENPSLLARRTDFGECDRSGMEGPRGAEPEVVQAGGRVGPAADRRPAAPRFVEPPAAAQYPIGAVDLGIVEVPAPLPDVAEQIVETPGVGSLALYCVDPLVRVAAVPGDLVKLAIPGGRRTGSAGVFPLGLGRQTV